MRIVTQRYALGYMNAALQAADFMGETSDVDGPHHEERWYEDRIRDGMLAELGILVIRVPSSELFDERLSLWILRITDACLQRRLEHLKTSSGTSTPGPVSRRKSGK